MVHHRVTPTPAGTARLGIAPKHHCFLINDELTMCEHSVARWSKQGGSVSDKVFDKVYHRRFLAVFCSSSSSAPSSTFEPGRIHFRRASLTWNKPSARLRH